MMHRLMIIWLTGEQYIFCFKKQEVEYPLVLVGQAKQFLDVTLGFKKLWWADIND